MDIERTSHVNQVNSFKGQPLKREEDESSSKDLKEILRNLRATIYELVNEIKKLAFLDNSNIDEEVLLHFLKKIEHFYAAINDLEEFINSPKKQQELHFALEVRAEIDDMLKSKIKKYTLCVFHKIEDFSFEMAMEKAVIVSLDDIKKMMTHLFDEIPDKNWDLVIEAFQKMAEKLLV